MVISFFGLLPAAISTGIDWQAKWSLGVVIVGGKLLAAIATDRVPVAKRVADSSKHRDRDADLVR